MTAASAAAAPRERPRASTEAQIVDAACACFERYGIRKTTIDDVAREAGVSRATMYRYFLNKEDLIERISVLEAEKVNTELRRQLKKNLSIEDTLVECLFLATRIAHDNTHIRAISEFFATASQSADPDSAAHHANRALWGSLLESAVQRGELASDLSIDEIASWLVLSQALLLIKVESVSTSDTKLRAFIRRFIVPPLLQKS